jgi:hypothetical protein
MKDAPMADLTDPQRKALEEAARSPLGVVEITTINGFGSRSKRLMFQRLMRDGYVREYVHGGYEITDAGRASLTGRETDPT